MNSQATAISVRQENFEAEVLQSSLPVLVDFWAPWCGPCRAIAPALEEIAKEFKGVASVRKVNVDDNLELARDLGVVSIPTLLFYRDGEVADRIVGVTDKQSLAKRLRQLTGQDNSAAPQS